MHSKIYLYRFTKAIYNLESRKYYSRSSISNPMQSVQSNADTMRAGQARRRTGREEKSNIPSRSMHAITRSVDRSKSNKAT
jgi:hypothetical protein